MKKALISILILLSVFSTAGAYDSGDIAGNPAPDFYLKDINGKSYSLFHYRSKVVILYFWGTNCVECIEGMPALNQLYNKYKNQGLVVIAISSTDRSETTVRDFAVKNKLDFPVFIDADRTTVRKYKVFGQPNAFFIDKGGIVIERKFGKIDWLSAESRRKIEELLK